MDYWCSLAGGWWLARELGSKEFPNRRKLKGLEITNLTQAAPNFHHRRDIVGGPGVVFGNPLEQLQPRTIGGARVINKIGSQL